MILTYVYGNRCVYGILCVSILFVHHITPAILCCLISDHTDSTIPRHVVSYTEGGGGGSRLALYVRPPNDDFFPVGRGPLHSRAL